MISTYVLDIFLSGISPGMWPVCAVLCVHTAQR